MIINSTNRLVCSQAEQRTSNKNGTAKPQKKPVFANNVVNSEEKQRQKKNRDNALKNGDLKYIPPRVLKLFGFKVKEYPAYYIFTANGKESIYYIKQKYGIKDHKIHEMNSYIKDDFNYIPEAGKEIPLPIDAFDN